MGPRNTPSAELDLTRHARAFVLKLKIKDSDDLAGMTSEQVQAACGYIMIGNSGSRFAECLKGLATTLRNVENSTVGTDYKSGFPWTDAYCCGQRASIASRDHQLCSMARFCGMYWPTPWVAQGVTNCPFPQRPVSRLAG